MFSANFASNVPARKNADPNRDDRLNQDLHGPKISPETDTNFLILQENLVSHRRHSCRKLSQCRLAHAAHHTKQQVLTVRFNQESIPLATEG
jgi:hypothetical protein